MMKTIIDTDPGIDDALAIIYALSHEDLSVHSITTVAGNVDVDRSSQNSQIILHQLGLTLPVSVGQSQPICYELQTARHFHGQDGLGNTTSEFDFTAGAEYGLSSAAESILGLVHDSSDSGVRLICLGPLTNVAQAILANPKLMKRIDQIVLMGGAFECYGNVTPTAEFNIYVDPHAAEIVFSSGIPTTILPLDVTQQVEISANQLEKVASKSSVPWKQFACSITHHSMNVHQLNTGNRRLYLHDPLVVGYVLYPDLFKTIKADVRVETGSSLTRGMTVADLRQPSHNSNVQVCVKVKSQSFLNDFFSTVFGLPQGDF